jgi:hypothetical protein
MPRIPTPLTWKRRNFAVFEPCGMIDRLYAVAVSGLVSGPFAIYKSPHANGFTLVTCPPRRRSSTLEMQNCCKDAAEKFAALDLNWWTCIPEEVIGPDLQEMRNIHERLKPRPWIASDWGRGGDLA